ncbi:electron transfer flavoprotein subunit beta/FixA family protein [Acidiluteibacter ferrifornacis]|uniref:Electron transfer flavoprotein subunit beta n=1 Tax=Acidiluteibacter ferrifornacis TaxID=2692424 RepID=A0A6N9NFA1_9FLAO|nr:electron transfer flavoprotein subunit beta/FixA family protein [Acidiluteibacter ferrifornacis]MBR9831859.1 electron transfer flavoprotein subunit beta/FixA family protein [bacterium]NBG65326.1 electron transfer flavoprotein beta subunit/FixA family protein [Acidiluteibacter ferrifornacis]
MKILVCISKAPDTTAKIAFTDNNTAFDTNGVQFIVNPYDEWYALVRGLELKEQNGGSVTVVNVGLAENEPIIRKALAIGADEAVRINVNPTDALQTAKEIVAFAKAEGFDMVLLGKETIDYNGSQLGGMIAELMDMPYVSLASKLEMEGTTATIHRDIQGGTEVVEVTAPFVISAAKGMAEARIPNMRGIMAARTKPLKVVEGSGANASTTIANYELPPAKGECHYIDADNAAELIELLHNEAKVI